MPGVVGAVEVELGPLERRYTAFFFYPKYNAWEEVDVNARCEAQARRIAIEWADVELQKRYTEVRVQERHGLYW